MQNDDPALGRSRWWVVLVVVIVLVAGGGFGWWLTRGRSGDAQSSAPLIGTATDQLIGFALDRPPVPGWRVSGADIGLPAGVEVGRMFAAVGQKAYFVTTLGCDGEDCSRIKGWVYGLDAATGAKLFDPVELDGFWGDSGFCNANGPSIAVCATPVCTIGDCETFHEGAWVVDLNGGELTFSGQPKIHSELSEELPGEIYSEVVGPLRGQTRLVGTAEGKGIYGVGTELQPTWFLPGGGAVFDWFSGVAGEAGPPELVVYGAGSEMRVGAVEDGRDLTPTPPEGATVAQIVAYPGGFAAEFAYRFQSAGVALFDNEGNQVASFPDAQGLIDSDAMPVVEGNGQRQVYTAEGEPVRSLPPGPLQYRSIGSMLFGKIEAFQWDSVDLLTGQRGPVCDVDLGASVGSNGKVIILHDTAVDKSVYFAFDPATCRTLWEVPDQSGSPGYMELTRAGTNLLQATQDAVVGLRAPN